VVPESRTARCRAVGADAAGQIVGQHRAQKGRVDQSASEFLNDNCNFDTGGFIGAQCSPARRLNLFVQAGNPTVLAEVLDCARPQIVGQLRGGVT
jgi:hypothetical protein